MSDWQQPDQLGQRTSPISDDPATTPRVLTVLGLDSVTHAHETALELALDACELGASVAHLHADPDTQAITTSPDGIHDLGNAVTSIPTSAGRLIRVAIGGLTRIQVADVITNLRPVVEHIILSGPDGALTQLSLEFATLSDAATIVGGSAAEVDYLTTILDQLGVANRPGPRRGTKAAASPHPERDRTRRIRPPGRL